MYDKNIIPLIGIIIVCILLGVVGINNVSLNKKYNKVKNELEYYQGLNNTYIHQVDSIKNVITERDSTIQQIIKEYENEEINIHNMDNDELILKFKELMWAD